MRYALALLFICLALLAFRPMEGEEDGRALYEQNCKSCHGKKGVSFLGLYPPLSNNKWVRSDTLIVQNITAGLSGPIVVDGKEYDKVMDPLPDLSNAEIAAIVNYVRREFAKIDKPISAERVGLLRKK